jgi:TPR repeat protein
MGWIWPVWDGFEDLGQEYEADQLYRLSLEYGLADAPRWETVQRLSLIKKRGGDYESAVALWKQAAEQGHIYAFVELAKYFEHRTADYNEAIRWTQAALQIVSAPTTPFYLRQQWQAELDHRLERLLRLVSRQKTQ